MKRSRKGLPRTQPLAERLFDKVEITPTCWIWTGSISSTGYGRINVKQRPAHAHRVMYELCVGPIADGLHIDHLCRNRACVNPDHLEPVTPQENTLGRGMGRTATAYRERLRTGLCSRGHSQMLHARPRSNGRTYCSECSREDAKRSYWRRKQSA